MVSVRLKLTRGGVNYQRENKSREGILSPVVSARHSISFRSYFTLDTYYLICSTCPFDRVYPRHGPLELTFTSPTESNFSLFGTTGDGPGAFQVSGSLTFNSNTGATGQYSAPAVCGVAADVGTVTGVEIKPFTGTYSGVLNDGDVLIVSVSEDPSTFSFLVVGTDNGAPLNLTGAVQGGAWTVSGTINGQPTDAVGLYDPTGDDFLVYSVNPLTFLGNLHSGSNPQAAVKQGKFIGKKD
jgi:hypothetical protein